MNETSPNQPASLAITILLVVLSLVLCLAWFAQLLFVIPEFEKVFADFRVRVPALTEATIAASRYFVKYWYIPAILVLIIAYPAIGYVSYYLRHCSRQRGLCLLWFVLIIGLPIAVQAITLVAVLSTQATLLDNLKGVR